MKLTTTPNPDRPDARAEPPSDRAVDHDRVGPPLSPVAALAHDLRSPLAAVLGFTRLAREDLRAGDVVRAAGLIDRIERSAAMLDAMLQCALGEPDPSNAADLRRVLEQIRAERKRELERRGISLVAPEESLVFAVRQGDLYRLMNNLVGNAIDHMGDASGGAIEVSACCHGERATLRVSDNGIGIPAERRERVFDVARTQPGADTAQCHRGLGLAIVRELAASWGGRAWAEASPSSGATLCVTIPVAR